MYFIFMQKACSVLILPPTQAQLGHRQCECWELLRGHCLAFTPHTGSSPGSIPWSVTTGRIWVLWSSWGRERRSQDYGEGLCSGWLEPPGQWLNAGKTKGEHFTFWGHPRAMPCLTLKQPAHSLLPVHLSFFQVWMLAGAVCIPSPRPARFILLYFCTSI